MEQIKRKKAESLKSSFTYAMLFTVFMIIILSFLSIWGCTALQKWVMPDKNQAYLHLTTTYFDGTQTTSTQLVTFGQEDSIPLIEAFEGNNKIKPSIKEISKYSIDKIENSFDSLSPKRKAAYSLLSAAMVGLPAIYSIAGVLLCALWFYRKKLQKPIEILSEATENIAKENLDFTVVYNGKDEMGDLCDSFEMMRQTLYANNQKVWNMLEERRMLQASVAHDLRNPISIIEGYTEYLQQNIPKGILSQEKLLHTVENLSTAAKRLEHYTNSIQDIQSLEDLEIHPEERGLPNFLIEMTEDFTHMAEQMEVEVHISIPACQKRIDGQILYRILENLFTNALRFAKRKIDISFSLEESMLCILVEDDGKGFAEKVIKNQERYTLSINGTDRHMGMGLIISRILCKKHGGTLKLSNRPEGGAKAEVRVSVK